MHDGRSTGTTVLVWLYGYPNMPGDLLAIGKITQMVPRDLLAMGKILYGYCIWYMYCYCLLYASDLSRRSMHGKMAGLVTVWHGSGPSHSPMHSPSHSVSHCLRNDGLSPHVTFGGALTGAYRPAEIRPRRRSSAHLPSPRGRVRSPKTRFPPIIEFICGESPRRS